VRRARRLRAFTLLEVMVSLGILAVALVAIGDLNGGAVRMHAYATRLTVAVQLSRGKMLDVEQQLHKDGLSDYSKEYHGDFEEEGWPNYKWRAKVIKPDFEADSNKLVDKLAGGLGLNTTDIASVAGSLGGGSGSSSSRSSSSSTSGSAGGAMGGIVGQLGPFGGLMDAQFKQIGELIKNSVREIKLTVSWKSGSQEESFDVVQHIVVLPEQKTLDSANATAASGQTTVGSGTGGPNSTQRLGTNTNFGNTGTVQ
jgi:general secretion pathway protein I